MEVYMNEADMLPTVLAVAPPAPLQTLLQANRDLQNYAKTLNVDRGTIKDWPSKRLSVRAESKTVFHAVFGRQVMDLAFGDKVRLM